MTCSDSDDAHTCFQWEFPSAFVKEIFQRRAHQIHHHHVVAVLSAKIVNLSHGWRGIERIGREVIVTDVCVGQKSRTVMRRGIMYCRLCVQSKESCLSDDLSQLYTVCYEWLIGTCCIYTVLKWPSCPILWNKYNIVERSIPKTRCVKFVTMLTEDGERMKVEKNVPIITYAAEPVAVNQLSVHFVFMS